MNSEKAKVHQLIRKIKSIYKNNLKFKKQYSANLKKIHPSLRKSANNLIDYISLRNHDIRELQNGLGDLGLSRLGRCENHVQASLFSTLKTLSYLDGVKDIEKLVPDISIKKGKKIITTNTKALLGYKSKGRRTRIMVTLPSEAATDYKMVYGLLSAGMNSARINCAHDSPNEWLAMIKNIKKANKSMGKNCRIIMDLGGPKLRTGQIIPGPKVIHIQPERDLWGNVIRKGEALLTNGMKKTEISGSDNSMQTIPIDGTIQDLEINAKIKFKDARNKNSVFTIKQKTKEGIIVEFQDSIYLIPGIKMSAESALKKSVLTIADFPSSEQKILLKIGDILVLHKEPIPGEPAKYDNNGKVIQHAHIPCSFPEIFKYLKKGEPVFFDDGKIEGIIQSITPKSANIIIKAAKENGSKLGSDKGINLPQSKISLRGLSLKDRTDLKFISKNADVVAISFVNSSKDIIQLLKELKKLKSKLGIIIKIETLSALRNLPSILLESMRANPLGIMIARGDLAIESGWLDMAKIQEELLLFCGAAHIPVIWATQVLENMAKKGMPSRAEITDAAMSQRSECVMLNKGPYINEAVRMLDHILKSMEPYRKKMSPMLPKVKKDMIIDV
jgi:pyruvate kinase